MRERLGGWLWEWLLRREVLKAQRRFDRRAAQEEHEHRASCHEQGRGHLACSYRHTP